MAVFESYLENNGADAQVGAERFMCFFWKLFLHPKQCRGRTSQIKSISEVAYESSPVL